jgi:hypothetical protein
MDLDPLREKALAAALTTAAQDGATAFGLHAGTEAELAFARALGRLVGALHVVKVLKESGRRECPEGRGVSMDDLVAMHFLRKRVAPPGDSAYLPTSTKEPVLVPLMQRLGS